ncbi:MAG: ATP-binding cassette domain-containing protein [Anaerolineaceae bacterium]|nr:ATP-binding cassette domain-containing protein [Anaerolineaceae bacterium]
MEFVKVSHIRKAFGDLLAVDDVSFDVKSGEIFGLLGPNGAGKTTAIRIMLDIFEAEQGEVSLFGSPIKPETRDRIGYLPEERGLYQDITLERCLLYLARLKGLSKEQAKRRMDVYLKRFDLEAYRKKKVKTLSKGMQQKAQLIVTLIHEPDLIIIDEPFTALDPVNTQMVKDILAEQRALGRSVIMCTHQMHQVEELCDRMMLIDHGKVLLYGTLKEIQAQFANKEVYIELGEAFPESLPGVVSMHPRNHGMLLKLNDHTQPVDLLRALVEQHMTVLHYELALPTLDEIFIQTVQGGEEQEAQ